MSSQLFVARLDLYESGTYDTQVARPYFLDVKGRAIDDLATRIHSATRVDPLNKIGGELVAGLSSGLVMPSASWERELIIPGGWQQRRLCFHLELHEIHHFGTTIYYFEGYSDYVGTSLQGSIDPDMVFHINSFSRLNRAKDFNGLSQYGFIDTISDNVQVIEGRAHSPNANVVYGLRPEDVFTGVQNKHLTNALSYHDEGLVLDDRIDHSTEVFKSRRENAVPSNFLAKIVDTYRSASTLADFGQNTGQILNRAIQGSFESSPYENPFIRALSDQRQMSTMTTFTMRDLVEIDPSANQRTTFLELASGLVQANQTDGWMGADLTVQIATVVKNAVPGLMIAHSLKSFAFSSTNMNMTGEIITTPHGQSEIVGISHQPTPLEINSFMRRFSTEVMPDIVCREGIFIAVHLSVWCDVYGAITIHVSIDGAPAVPYTAPCFCDALSAPITTVQQQTYSHLIEGIEDVINACSHATSASNSINRILDI